VADAAEKSFSLPPGTRLEEYAVLSVIGHGSFGITYLAEDTNLGTRIAIKEYLPQDYAVRDSTRTVRARKAGFDEALERGKDAFLKEARLLALVSHPNIVKVRRFFRAFGTAYIAMDFIDGRSLADVLERDFPGGGYPPAKLKRMMIALLEGLGALHRAGVIHRDLKPANVLITADGNPVLVDFGAARNFERSLQRGMTVIMTPGYAPLEQYSEEDAQGPFTDIYAIGALAYRALTGRPPLEPYKRLAQDNLVPASSAGAGRYPAALLSAIDWALALHGKDRPQSASALLALLAADGDSARTVALAPGNRKRAHAASAEAPAAPAAQTRAARRPLTRAALPIALAVLLVGAVAGAYSLLPRPASQRVEIPLPAAAPERVAVAPEVRGAGDSRTDRAVPPSPSIDRGTEAGPAAAPAGETPVGTTNAGEPRTAAEATPDTAPPAIAPEQQAAIPTRINPEPNDRQASQVTRVMGLSLADPTPELRRLYGLADDAAGVVVADIDGKSQAAEKGVRAGDMIVDVVRAGVRHPVRSPTDLAGALADARKDGAKTLQLLVGRHRETRLVALTLDQGAPHPRAARASDARCTRIVEAAELGEAVSDDDRSYLRDHCR
jgi:tRNA A-37 threonylcarbamoyl transferase component Bud32